MKISKREKSIFFKQLLTGDVFECDEKLYVKGVEERYTNCFCFSDNKFYCFGPNVKISKVFSNAELNLND